MSKKVMISLPDRLLEEIDAAAGEEERSRSELIREATRKYLTERETTRRPIDDPRVRAALETMDRIAGKIDCQWDAAKAIREMRDSR